MNVDHNVAIPLVDIDLCQRALRKMKLNESPGFGNISAKHLLYGDPTLYVHLCLLFSAMMRHSSVTHDLA